MSQQVIVRRDTQAWRMQTWLSFAAAFIACGAGIWQMPSETLDRAFLAIAAFFSLFTCFTVAKTVRDNRDEQIDTAAWVAMVWIGFAIAIALTGWGLFRMTIDMGLKGYMVVSLLYLASSTFTLAKTVRDQQEADLIEAHGRRQLDAPATVVKLRDGSNG